MNIKEHGTIKLGAFIFFAVFFCNLLYLDYIFIKNGMISGPTMHIASVDRNMSSDTYCDNETCVPEIYNAIYEATASGGTSQIDQVVQSNEPKELFVPLGTSTGSFTTMTTVPGMSSYIDSSLYPNIESVTFEISATTPTANQTVTFQLYNQTANHPVWNSVVSMSGGGGSLLVSSPITLDPGNNLYNVQMQTQLGYPTTINTARVHILLN